MHSRLKVAAILQKKSEKKVAAKKGVHKSYCAQKSLLAGPFSGLKRKKLAHQFIISNV
jgi:hypothetical protein